MTRVSFETELRVRIVKIARTGGKWPWSKRSHKILVTRLDTGNHETFWADVGQELVFPKRAEWN